MYSVAISLSLLSYWYLYISATYSVAYLFILATLPVSRSRVCISLLVCVSCLYFRYFSLFALSSLAGGVRCAADVFSFVC